MFSAFSILIGFGVILGLGWVSWHAPRGRNLDVFDQGLLVLIFTLVGSRAGYVLLHWGYYAAHAIEIHQVWLGGLSGWGAIYGWMVGGVAAAVFSREPVGKVFDRLIPVGMCLAGMSWLGAWIEGSAYGPVASDAWWGVLVVDESGTWLRRFPTQLVGALLVLGLWVGMDVWMKRRSLPAGLATSIGLIGLGMILFGLSYLRVDSTIIWQGFRLDAWAALGVVLFGGLGIAAVLIVKSRRSYYPSF